jgi:3-hydroxyacyl-CoA dehydrogenase
MPTGSRRPANVPVQFVTAGAHRVAVLTLDNPPVNALSFSYCAELLASLAEIDADAECSAVIVTGANGTFSAGADVNDFQAPPPPGFVSVRDVVAAFHRSQRVTVAAIDGTTLGGGLELSLACDYRIASERSSFALPEVRLGLLPGAGGTQRLPRLIGARPALDFALRGRTLDAKRCLELGIVDRVVEADPVAAAIASIDRNEIEKRRVAGMAVVLGADLPAQALPFVVASAHKMLPSEERGGRAAHAIVDAVAAAVELPFDEGIARESRLFEQLAESDESKALRHLFFAERRLADVDGVPGVMPRTLQRIGVLGAGTMGTGIALAFAQAGYTVAVVDPDDAAIERARRTVMENLAYQVRKGRLDQRRAWDMGRSIAFGPDVTTLAQSDLVVEAIVERLDAKVAAFRALAAVLPSDAILATNTSTLNVDALAGSVEHPERVVGLHFFVPANIMPLLEIVRGARTSAQTIATAFDVAKRMRKKGVVSGNAFGFIGNRMIFDYVNEAVALAESGAGVARIDRVMTDFGFAMGPFAMSDLSGLDVARYIADSGHLPAGRRGILDLLVDSKRLGQKASAGYYRYDPQIGNGRTPIEDPQVDALFAQQAARDGVVRVDVIDDDIRERLLSALVDRGKQLLHDGVALRAGDIDIAYVYGYGFPPYRGGPMWNAGIVDAAPGAARG